MRELVALCLLAAAVQAVRAVHLDFDSLDGWVHSNEEKWSGRAKLEGKALLVSVASALLESEPAPAPALPGG